jgi:4-hydroxybenzoate polyprenyltransferase
MTNLDEQSDATDELASHLQFRGGTTIRNYIELMRLPNVFTAMADVAMGFLFVQSVDWRWDGFWDAWTLGVLLAASSALYLAGVVLNDVFDVEADREQRGERPLPSGRVSLAAARRLGWRLLFLGVLLGAGAGFFVGHLRPGVVAALLAGCILLYDGWLKSTPLGPAVMGTCRMLNVMLGMSAVDAPLRLEHWLAAGGIGVYVAGVTWFARRENQRSSRWQLAISTVVMMLGVAMLAGLPSCSERVIPQVQLDPVRWYLLTGVLGMLIAWRCVWAAIEPIPERVRIAVAQCVLSIVMLDAVVCYSVRGVGWECLMILVLLVPAVYLGRWIDVT